ncbi:MAG: hypothetical protein AB7F31_00585 [Parachlamydiales bacterium]
MGKRFGWALGIGGVILALLYSIPFLLSTSWGNQFLLAQINGRMPGRWGASQITLRWFGRQSVDHLSLFGLGPDPILEVERIETGLSLWNLLWGTLHFGNTLIDHPRLNLMLEGKSSNLEQALAPPGATKKTGSHSQRPLRFQGHFTLDGGQLAVGGNRLYGRGNATLRYPQEGKFTFTGETGSGSASGEGEWSQAAPQVRLGRSPLPLTPWEGRGIIEIKQLPAAIVETLLHFVAKDLGLAELLGDKLNLTAKGEVRSGKGSGQLSASSTTLNTALSCALEEGSLFLTDPARASLNVVPLFAAPLLSPHSISLAGPGHLEAVCTAYRAPLTALIHPELLHLRASIAPFNLTHPSRTPLTITRAALQLDKEANTPFHGEASIQGKGFSAQGRLASKREWALETTQLPLPWVDPLLPAPLTPYLGSTLSCKIALQGEALTAQANTPLLNLPGLSLLVGEQVTLTQPTTFSYLLTPELLPLLASPGPLTCSLAYLTLPIGPRFNPEQAVIHGQIASDTLPLLPLPLLGSSTLQQFLIAIKGPSLAAGLLEFHAYVSPKEERPFISPGLPITLNGLFSMRPDYHVDLTRVHLALDNRFLEGHAIAAYTYPSTIALLFPGYFKFLFSPQQFPTLATEGLLTFDLDPSEVAFSLTQPKRSQFSGRLSLPHLGLKGGEAIDNLEGALTLSGAKDVGQLTLKATTSPPSSSLTASGILQGLFSGNLHGSARLSAPSLPTNLLTLFTPKLAVNELAGPLLKIDAKSQFETVRPFSGSLDIRLGSEYLKGDLGLKIGKTLSLLSPSRPATLEWRVTPAGFKALYQTLKKTPPLTLIEPATLSAKITALDFPLSQFNPAQSTLVASATSTPLNLSRQGKSALVENLLLKIDSKNLSKALYALLNGEVVTQSRGSFRVEGSAENLFSPLGKLAPKEASLQLKGELKSLQTPYLFDLLPFDTSMLSALFGQQISGKFQAKVDSLSGPCSADLRSQNLTLSLDGALQKGTLTLNRPFKATLQVTPDIGLHLLKLANPLFLSAVRSEKPVTFSLQNRDFSLPLFPFEPTKITATGALDLGKIWLTNRDPVALLLSLFKGEEYGAELSAWSTPLYFTLGGGQMRYERMDTLFGSRLHTAFWGEDDLATLQARMNLALFPDSPSPLLIPFRGPLTEMKADWRRAAAQVAALALRQGGREGKIAGALLDVVAGQGAAPIPPPTTTPYPWAVDKKGNQE